MNIFEIIIIGFCLAMDAFAISICKGLSIHKFSIKRAIAIALYFGLFQGVMPLFGYLLGSNFYNLTSNIDHWISFVLLTSIGLNMIKNDKSSKAENYYNDSVSLKEMLPLSFATSIDALTMGITFCFSNVNIIHSSLIIAFITFLLSFLGVIISNKINIKFKDKSQIIGGSFLIILGIKILIEHLSH